MTARAIPHLLLFESLSVALMALLAVVVIADFYFRRRVRESFPADWKAMGAPAFLNQSMASTWTRFLYMIVRADYRKLPDSRVKILGDVVRLAYFLFMAVFILDAALFFILRAPISN